MMHDDHMVDHFDAIETTQNSQGRFFKRYQTKDDAVQRLQHVAYFSLKDTLLYSVMTNGI